MDQGSFLLPNHKLAQNPNKTHETREVIGDPKILDTIIAMHNFFGYINYDITAEDDCQYYNNVSRKKVIFLIKFL